MEKKAGLKIWSKILDSISFDDNLDVIEQKVEAEGGKEYSFDQFLEDSERFYYLYIKTLGFNNGAAFNKALTMRFHIVAQLLNMTGHKPNQESPITMFDYMNTPSINKAANLQCDDFYEQDNLVFGRDINFPQQKVDYISLDKDDKIKVSKVNLFNLKYSSLNDFDKPEYLLNILDLYGIKNVEDVSFNTDKNICSIFYN